MKIFKKLMLFKLFFSK